MAVDRAKNYSISLYPDELEIARRHARTSGANNISGAIRNILRQWDAMTKAGVYVTHLPHPDDATPVPIIHIEKRD